MADLYAILDWPHPSGLDVADVARGLLGAPGGIGAKFLQLRSKAVDTCTRIALAAQVAPISRAAGVPLLINDDVAVALSSADGVHLGQDDLHALGGPPALHALRRRAPAGFRIGLSTHDLAQVRASADLPIDYIGFGPVLPTRSKQRPEPCVGLDGLAAACGVARHPVVAIGGLDATSALSAAEQGADMVAMIGALVAPTVDEIAARVTALASALARVTR
jgi:thiamine-phosphate pyrophosphorylase